jgi:hypothetical protein
LQVEVAAEQVLAVEAEQVATELQILLLLQVELRTLSLSAAAVV